ncbi:heavy-metal-associated domain-containing protein [Jiangella alkaliphila]|uniref:Copper ion binding protein n=1 Tax=Jiangella alkaliphila TaxID=419479 RepID=A0A1H2M3U8_9ACTN|nr:heavy-metal-associated domain-containing protein [Jiangella alkaliphila]SDU87804.1 copper ion binding protein [Jiangella alkaliphila]
MTTSTYTVVGMTCDHCAGSVREELGRLDGVSRVDVDLATGNVDVTSAAPLDGGDVKVAVEEAGYQLAGS